jgi:hypothetical protein
MLPEKLVYDFMDFLSVGIIISDILAVLLHEKNLPTFRPRFRMHPRARARFGKSVRIA